MRNSSSRKTVSIIICFCYSKNDSIETLPSTDMDLFMSYNVAKKIDSKNIFVITDVNENPRMSKYTKKIVDGEVDGRILDLIDDLKDSGHYIGYENRKKTIRDIETKIKGADRLFLYISCHGVSGNIILPDDDKISSEDLRKVLTENTNRKCKIFSIIDCCDFTGLYMPLVFRNGDYRSNKPYIVCTQSILIFLSSTLGNRSLSRRSGSDFTVSVLNKIEPCITMSEMKREVEGINIFSSFPEMALWTWVFGFKITAKIEGNCILVEKHL